MHMGFEPEELIYTQCCKKQRPAKCCVVQSYYDGLMIWCAHEKGCKDPKVIAAKQAQEFANRSAGQKARWLRESNAQAKRGGAVAASDLGAELCHGTLEKK
jgi:hypothetical protein